MGRNCKKDFAFPNSVKYKLCPIESWSCYLISSLTFQCFSSSVSPVLGLWNKIVSNKWKCCGLVEAIGFAITLQKWKLTVHMQCSLLLLPCEIYSPKSWYPHRGYHPSCSYDKQTLSSLSIHYLQRDLHLLKVDGKWSEPIFSVVQLHHEMNTL